MHDRPTTQRPPGRSSRDRGRLALTLAAVVALLVGGVLAVAGVAPGGDGSDDVVLTADAAVTERSPSTVPPLTTTDAPQTSDSGRLAASETTSRPDRDDRARDRAAADVSPLAALVGPRYSTIVEDVAPRARPVKLEIDAIDVARFPLRAVGLESNGEMEIPDETEIGWYQYGATAGQPGATVLAAHVSWNGTTGPFAQLGAVDPGARIAVTLDDGTVRHYEAVERTMYGKLELPRERIWRTSGEETLVLITCGGDFNPEISRYLDNIVVYAVPVA